jgi:FMN phosphatase YigB (HAD superfamily)
MPIIYSGEECGPREWGAAGLEPGSMWRILTTKPKLVMTLRRARRLLRTFGLPRMPVRAVRGVTPRNTFDVFDTLLTRVVEPPQLLWAEVGRRAREEGITTLDAEAFRRLRRDAAGHIRTLGRQPILEEVYDVLGERLGLAHGQRVRLLDLEFAVEEEAIRGIPAGRRLVEVARALRPGEPIIFISDMHLPSTFLRRQLERHGCWQAGDRLWVSGEVGVRKADTRLFLVVRQFEDLMAEPLVHVGNNLVTDWIAARWAGFDVRPFTGAMPNRYEGRLASCAKHADDVCGWMAGAARLTRLELPEDDAPESVRALREVAASVVGPFLASYCLWLLRRATEEKLERLYFISRDGEVLWQTCRALAEALGVSVELRYLYGGRLSWQRPALAIDADEAAIVSLVERTLFGYTVVRPSGVAVRFGLPPDFVHQALTATRPPGAAADDAPLSPRERTELHAWLTSRQGMDAIRAAAEAALPPTLAYLRQEGLLDGTPWALVDVGWRGTTVRTLNKLLRAAGGEDARVFFTGYVGEPGEKRLPNCEAFIWDSDHPDPLPRPAGALAIVEAICSGSHGPVGGYAFQADGSVRPVLLSEAGLASETWWLEELRSAIERFMGNLTPHLRPAHLASADPHAVLAVLRELCERPSRGEALALGSCPREEDAQGDSVFPMARSFQITDIPGLLRTGKLIGRNLAWRPGALVLTSAPTRGVIQAILAAADAVRGLRR